MNILFCIRVVSNTAFFAWISSTMCQSQQASRIDIRFHVTFMRTIDTKTIEVGHDSTVDPAHERAKKINIQAWDSRTVAVMISYYSGTSISTPSIARKCVLFNDVGSATILHSPHKAEARNPVRMNPVSGSNNQRGLPTSR